MKNPFEKIFAKWETKKRMKMGDKAFLEKYVKSLPKSDKRLKILYPLNGVLALANVVLSAINGNYLAMLCWIAATLCWTHLFYSHHFCLFDLHTQRVEEWKKELEELNKNALCASVPPCEKT